MKFSTAEFWQLAPTTRAQIEAGMFDILWPEAREVYVAAMAEASWDCFMFNLGAGREYICH
jgi:hypothetical protein